ncbi:unnamed protein product [Porites lobata]|uniref:Uncharacterized protein n=1 Tax=Porites lobata TaxID=104759 RepID=A0ABN8Q667_9CNID|nr:unnamed protein product [Porites lobata]
MSEESQKIANSGGTSPVDLNAMFAELLDDAKRDILAHVQDSIEKVYADFEDYETSPESGEASTDVLEKTSPAIDANLAEKVKSLLTEKLTKEKLAEVQNKYLRPENCTNLVAPKINKQIWQQLRQETRNNDSAFQKAQSLLLSGLYAVLQLCNSANGDQWNVLTHTAVLLLSANRELNLKRRDLIRPDLNKQYAPLCNPSTAGDDLNKEVEELTKSKPGPYSAPAESQDLGNQDPVGSPAEVSQTTLATIIANQVPFKAGGLRDCLHVWKTITSDPFILDTIRIRPTHCHIEFDWEPGICTSTKCY